MVLNHFLLLLVYFCLTQCGESRQTNGPKHIALKKPERIVIDIQPFKGISDEHVRHVYRELTKVYPDVHINKPVELPSHAYRSKRNRYRADSLIKFLRAVTLKGHVTIGITGKDISTTKEQIEDYGIMGLGYQPGAACIVSTFRLNKKNLQDQLFKVSVHELGHTQGLPHCEVLTCYMRDAKGKNPNDEEKEFCPKCRKHLVLKGWTFENTPQ
jgi:archaemetzincin